MENVTFAVLAEKKTGHVFCVDFAQHINRRKMDMLRHRPDLKYIVAYIGADAGAYYAFSNGDPLHLFADVIDGQVVHRVGDGRHYIN